MTVAVEDGVGTNILVVVRDKNTNYEVVVERYRCPDCGR